MKPVAHFLVLVFLAGIIGSCANRVTPTGGKKDIDPPEVLSANPDNYQTGFASREIILTFNEYVQLKDAQKQVLISPPVDPPPQFEVRKKSLIISLPETLGFNTTYTINFGSALSDFTEGNVLSGYQYVFSTGGEIDSLRLTGRILDALTGQPVKNSLALVYPSTIADSMIGKAPPSYYGRAADDGNYVIGNIRKGVYRVAALEDKNNNITHEYADEALGVSGTPLQLHDSAAVDVLINRQPPVNQSVKSGRLEVPGKLITAFARPVKEPSWEFTGMPPGDIVSWFSARRDTIILYCTTPFSDSARVVWSDNHNVIDTVLYRPERGASAVAGKAVKPLTAVQGIAVDSIAEPFIRWASPLKQLDYSSIMLKKDSVPVRYSGIYQDSLKLVSILNAGVLQGNYTITILPGAAEDIYGRINDTLHFSFSIPSERAAGSIAFNFITAKTGPFLLQLVNEKFELIRQREADGSQVGVFNNLNPGQYRLRRITDSNNNKRWDEGIVRENIFPEQVYYYPGTITVRANWEVEVEWKD